MLSRDGCKRCVELVGVMVLSCFLRRIPFSVMSLVQ
jgi:hypothetical protein